MKEIKFYLESLPFDPDNLEEAIHDELREQGVKHTGQLNIKIIVEYEPQRNHDDYCNSIIAGE